MVHCNKNYSLLETGGIGGYKRLDNHNANSALWRNEGSNGFLNYFLELAKIGGFAAIFARIRLPINQKYWPISIFKSCN